MTENVTHTVTATYKGVMMRRFAVFGLLTAVALLAAGCAGSGRHTASSLDPASQGGGLATTGHHTSSSTVPRWATKCLPKGRQRLGTAPQFVGLTFTAAQRLIGTQQHLKHPPDLVFAGAGGRCSDFNDLVYRRYPVAVVFNTRNPREPKARIIAAVRAVGGWQPRG